MRTTLTIDDDVLEAARTLAQASGRSLGETVSTLARRGLKPAPAVEYRGSFPVFEVRETAQVFGPREVELALDENEPAEP